MFNNFYLGEWKMKLKNYHLVLFVVGFVMGVLLIFQFKLVNIPESKDKTETETTSEQVTTSLVNEISEAKELRNSLKEKSQGLITELDDLANVEPELSEMKSEMDLYRIEAGFAEVIGSGVEVTLDDNAESSSENEKLGDPNLYLLHDEDILKVLNELRAGGAEALSLNGQRLLSISEVQCVGPTILVNKTHRLTPPFIITAIGDSDNMEKSLNMTGGVVDSLKVWGIHINIEKKDELIVPAYSGGLNYEYVQPIQDEEE